MLHVHYLHRQSITPGLNRGQVDALARLVLPKVVMVLNSLSDGGDRLVDGVEHHSVAALPDHPEKKQRRDVQELPGWQW